MKKLTIRNVSEIEGYIELISHSAKEAQLRISELSEKLNAIELLGRLKFEKEGYDPLDINRELNFIEQLNQTITSLASMKAAEFLFSRHVGLDSLVLNLGTSSGSDLESDEFGGIAAKVFAATQSNSNNKLNKDIKKVSSAEAFHKYSFFMCPGVEWCEYLKTSSVEVKVWSLEV